MSTTHSHLAVQGMIDSLTMWGATGWAWMPEAPEEKLQIQASVNGEIIGTAIANELRADLVREGKGGVGNCGFTLTFKGQLASDCTPVLQAVGQSVTAFLKGAERSNVVGYVDRMDSLEAAGWAWMPAEPNRALEIVAVLDDKVIGRAAAHQLRPDLAASGRGTGRYGFVLIFDFPIIAGTLPIISARTEESDTHLQRIENAHLATPEYKFTGRTGSIEVCSGNIISGWAWDSNAVDERTAIDIFVDETHVGTVAAEWFREDLLSAGIGDGRHAFYYESPGNLDGRIVSVRFATDGARLAPVSGTQPNKSGERVHDGSSAIVTDSENGDHDVEDTPTRSVSPSQQLRQDVLRWSDDIALHFDASWYRETYPEVPQDDAGALDDFLEVGIFIGRDPHILFASEWYAQRYQVVTNDETPALLHYITQGAQNQLSPHPLFHVTWYSNQFTDFEKYHGTPLQHYIAVGMRKGMSSTPIFDSAWYRRTYLGSLGKDMNAFMHYMKVGEADGACPNAFFDVEFYLQQFPTLAHNGVNALVHYLESGAEKGADPSIRFKTSAYLEANPDVERAKRNPLEHFMRSGRREGRSPLGEKPIHNPSNVQNLIFSRFGGTEYGPIEKVLSYASSLGLPSRVPSLCIHVHLYHKDLAEEISYYLHNVQIPYTLLISVRESDIFDWNMYFMERHANIRKCLVKCVPNKGRDVAPWIVMFAPEILHHELFFHCHTKKSEYDARFANWRRYLFHNTLGSQSVVNEVLTLFDADRRLGLIYPAYYSALNAQPSWGGNRLKASFLADRLGAELPDRCPDYPAGSFFWARAEFLRPLLTCGIDLDDFEIEAAQIDGTLAHGIERVLGHLGHLTGMKKLCITTDVAFNLTDFWDVKRRDKTIQPPQISHMSPTRVEALNDARRIVVYTCVTAGFDEVVPPIFVHSDVDYVVFSDKPLPESPHFTTRICQYVDPNPRRTARYVKTHPHILLRGYDVAVWLDANIMFRTCLTPFLESVSASGADVGVIYHTTRSGYIEEAAECARIGADERDVLDEQVNKYKTMELENSGLIETNFMIAVLGRPNVRKFFDIWWREISSFSLRDQVSVNYALSTSKASAVSLLAAGRSVRDDGRFLIFEHKVTDRKAIVEYIKTHEPRHPSQRDRNNEQ